MRERESERGGERERERNEMNCLRSTKETKHRNDHFFFFFFLFFFFFNFVLFYLLLRSCDTQLLSYHFFSTDLVQMSNKC